LALLVFNKHELLAASDPVSGQSLTLVGDAVGCLQPAAVRWLTEPDKTAPNAPSHTRLRHARPLFFRRSTHVLPRASGCMPRTSVTTRLAQRPERSSFTLMEVVIAMAIFAIAMVSVLALMPAAALLQKRAYEDMQSQVVARSAAATMRACYYYYPLNQNT